jgi:hypothetical protein
VARRQRLTLARIEPRQALAAWMRQPGWGDVAALHGEFVHMTGLPERSGQRLLAHRVKGGLPVSDGPKPPVRIGLPLDAPGLLSPCLPSQAATANSEP